MRSPPELFDGQPRLLRDREAEARTAEAERKELDDVGAAVLLQVAPGNAEVEDPVADVERDVARTQKNEINVVHAVADHELPAGAGALVARFAEQADGVLGKSALVRYRQFQHDKAVSWVLEVSVNVFELEIIRDHHDLQVVEQLGNLLGGLSRPSYSAAIQTSPASSTTFFPIKCLPRFNSLTVPDSGSAAAAFAFSSSNNPSNVFICGISLSQNIWFRHGG